jgi:zinc protease
MRARLQKALRKTVRMLAIFSASGLFTLSLATVPTQAMNIQKVTSPKGIVAWLVEDHTLPMISMQFGFKGGTAQDPEGKEGLGYFVSGMLDEGAGDIESQAFQETLQELAIDISFDASKDVFTGGVRTLSANKDEAFRLLNLAITKPRMDEDAVERVRKQILSIIKANKEDPETVAMEVWFANVFDGHPYGRPSKGTLESVAAITPDDLKTYVKGSFALSNLKIAVVGSINAAELGTALDQIFGDLPKTVELKTIPEAEWKVSGREIIVPMTVPQTVVNFGYPGPKRDSPDYYASYVLNYILGGGGFNSRLMEEVREKRGLAYSAYSYLNPLDHAGLCIGGVATKNESVRESIKVIKEVLTQISKDGPSEEELKNAKQYLTGSYALRFSSSTQIARIVMWVQIENLGIDYIERRNDLIEAVSLEDIKRVAALIKPEDLVITIVGQPAGYPASKVKEAAPGDQSRG